MSIYTTPNEELLPMLWKIVNTLLERKWNKQVQSLLYWIWWTIWKWYDSEEKYDTIIDNCKEWLENPTCFNDK
jgi:hypothetical protein